MSTFEAGAKFANYTIEGLVAGGGMGKVYAARDELYGSVVALKVLHKGLHADDDWRLRFNLEGVIGQRSGDCVEIILPVSGSAAVADAMK